MQWSATGDDFSGVESFVWIEQFLDELEDSAKWSVLFVEEGCS